MIHRHFRHRPKRRRGLHATRRRGWRLKLAELIWPSMGWRAFMRYAVLKVLRLADNPHRVALGVAIGLWVSWTPLFGFHNIIIVVLCWALGASILAGLVGSFIGNPWTLPLMWWMSYELGQRLLGGRHMRILTILDNLTLDHLWAQLWPLVKLVFMPTMLGAAILGTVSGLVIYWATRGLMQAYLERRAKRWAAKHGKTPVLIKVIEK